MRKRFLRLTAGSSDRDAVFLDPSIKGGPAHAKRLCHTGEVSRVMLQRLHDHGPLDLIQGHAAHRGERIAAPGRAWSLHGRDIPEIGGGKDGARSHQHGAFDEMPQLAQPVDKCTLLPYG